MSGSVVRTPADVPTILAIADRPGWAIDFKTQNLRRALLGRYEVIERFQADVSEADVDRADVVLVFYWLELLKMSLSEQVLMRNRARLVIGICSHTELEGERRERGLATLRSLPRAVFANNRALQREYAPLLDVPVYYTPNGVDVSFFTPAHERRVSPAGELRVGWAGSLTNHGPAHRGFHDVIEPGTQAVPGVTLLTAVREQRWRSHAEMVTFYRDLDVYVCASRSEGAPNSCLEAAACGVPIVTTRVGSMPELIEDGGNGFFFDGTADGLAERLRLLGNAPSLRASMSVRIRESVLDWDWTVQSDNYARMFDDVLAANDHARASSAVV